MSKDSNSVAWTSGFKGMVEAKVIKHAFKNFPKLRVGAFSQLQSEKVDEPEAIDYGIDITEQQPSADPAQQQQNTIDQSYQQPFNPQQNFTNQPQQQSQGSAQQNVQQTPAELDF